jgi:hypothetical protein
MSERYKQQTRWDGDYVSLSGSRKVPNDIVQKAFSEHGIKAAEAVDRGFFLFCHNRKSDPVLVLAPSNEGKIPPKVISAVPLFQAAKPVSTSEKLSPGLKSLKHSAAFLSLLRILSLVMKKGLEQERSNEVYKWLKDMPDDTNIVGIPETILKCVGDICRVGTGKDNGLSNIQDLFSKLCGFPPLGQLGKLFQFHRLDLKSPESHTVITVGDRREWEAIKDITIKQPPTFLAVNVRYPGPEAQSSLTLKVSFGNSTISVPYKIFAFLSPFDEKNIAAFKLQGPFYHVFIGGNAAEQSKKQKKGAEKNHLKEKCSFLIFEQEQAGLAEQNKNGTGECQSKPGSSLDLDSLSSKDSSATSETRNQHRLQQRREVTSHAFDDPARYAALKSPEREPLPKTLSCDLINRIAVSEQRLDSLIRDSIFSQEHFAIINGFSEAKNPDLDFELSHLRMIQTEEKTKPTLSVPRKCFQNTVAHSFSRFSFPELTTKCVQNSDYIFVDMLHMDERSKYGCSHVMTTADLSIVEIDCVYPKIRIKQERYETHLIQKGRGIWATLALYNLNCTENDFRIQVVQLPKIRDEFRARDFGYSGQVHFEALSHAHLILGMLSEMAGPGSEVTDEDIPLEFVVKLPASNIPGHRRDIIQQILNRWTIPTCTNIPHCLNLTVVLYVIMMSRMLF